MRPASESRRVYIAQLKCPGNHCVLAAYDEFDSEGDAAVLGYRLGAKMAELVKAKVLRHECGICKATDLQVQIRRTPFRTMAEATPFMKQCEEDQRRSAEWLKWSRH